MRGVRRVHFVGIGGAGMCAIAEVLLRQGGVVTGSDLAASGATRRLTALGATTYVGHCAAAVGGVGRPDVVVASSAVADDNVEVLRARELGIPVIPRARMLGELMRWRQGIAVAGAHGKTTTAGFVAGILRAAGLDPTFVIGGELIGEGGGAGLGGGPHLVAEADESDASFLHLDPVLAVVTNIDRDHMGNFGHDFERLLGAFRAFIHRLPFYGAAIVGIDDAPGRRLAGLVERPLRTFGFRGDANYRVAGAETGGARWRFRARRPHAAELELELPLPGRHNILNALAAVAAATEEGVADEAIVCGIRDFRGVARRFEVAERIVGGRRVTVVDDYGHHPAAIARVIETARTLWSERRLVMVYQPHRYTRTRDLLDDFAGVLAGVDDLVLTEVYAAGEAPLADADGRALGRAIADRGRTPVFAATLEEACGAARDRVREGDVLLIQGAGDVGRLCAMLGEADA